MVRYKNKKEILREVMVTMIFGWQIGRSERKIAEKAIIVDNMGM